MDMVSRVAWPVSLLPLDNFYANLLFLRYVQ